MDYSLLLVIEQLPPDEEDFTSNQKEIIVNDIVEEMIIENQIKQTFNQQKISTEYTTSSGRTARERNIF